MMKLFDSKDPVSYLYVLIPIPRESVARMLENLDVSDNVFIIDIVKYTLDKNDNPFIDTVMEVPSHVLVDGPDQQTQLDGLVYTIQKWYESSDFHEMEVIINELKQEAALSGVEIEPASGKNLRSSILVEFQLTKRRGDESDD